MKILIIGHSVLDYVEFNHKTTIQPGGIFYTASAFDSLKKDEDEFLLLTSSDGKTNDYFIDVVSKFNLSYAVKTEAIPEVHLKIWEDKEREEYFKNFTEPLSLKLIDNFNQFDAIFINMISGNDITLSDLQMIRKRFSGNIYIDIHALSKGEVAGRKRTFRKVPNVKEWLQCANIIQVNEFEFDTISEGNSHCERAKFVLENGPEILIVTKGDRGGRIYYRNREEIASIFLPAENINSVNKIGCGDIFGAYFFYSYINNKNLVFALKAANKAAAIATTYKSAKNFINLKHDFIK